MKCIGEILVRGAHFGYISGVLYECLQAYYGWIVRLLNMNSDLPTGILLLKYKDNDFNTKGVSYSDVKSMKQTPVK